jgi:predicted DNA-binding WGR domain protein
MTHVLIVISWLGGGINGAAISTQEFTSAERCDAARLTLIEYAKARGLEETLRPICTQK